MISPQLVRMRRHLLESCTVIADTRRNVVINSSELGFNIVLYRSNSYATRAMSACWQDADNAREPTTLLRDMYDTLRISYEISTTYAPLSLDGDLWREVLIV